ncbi:cell division/cell wall cluster transcriptional repressor MraZ [Kyrpidia spormannii]|uniref:Transcriptional regulator MraZ n=2 Tax=Kyrpidia spormannii TaxID=2055160 RepID=A0A2K8N5T4_9BACL|nr:MULTISPECIES: division/cell wall cluster transcriptional repressor MraZ [Kyrpidia]ATY84719.1 cell division/cell wall cluster transcriptional repressor MraZ [Kyrpidia spormannii]MCL6577262.1 division/cell wall cluster transcriptional repressor MraZ [Kyrpidia sp.]CAB3391774.1 inhibitor of RsmH and transcriptional regulator [Kyrpidia spormannii]CAB3392691.1 inhibitor of RsmH and transcriptional regulator [Kyrpidia spormannii]
MFIGEFSHTVDDKGRLTMPAKFREGLGPGFILTRGLDRCLFAYPRKEWESVEAKLKTLPVARPEARAFMRFFFSGATECEFDRQGRILIPGSLREYASLEKDCVIIGVSSRVEVWAKEAWDAYFDKAQESFAGIAESLAELGF